MTVMDMPRFAYPEPLRERETLIDIGPNGQSIDLLRAVYRNPSIPLPVRIRCAVAALPHEVPRLQVSALVNEHSFAELLEARIKRYEAMNGQTQERPQIEAPTDARPNHPITTDRRFRRL
jgi:hypothetical protein